MSAPLYLIRSLFSLDAQTGQLTSLITGRKNKTKNASGYGTVVVRGKKYYAHRVAWLLHYGEWPKKQIDHINGDKSDNRICNLRDVSQAENAQNQRRATQKSITGVLGASPCKGKFIAKLRINGKATYVGQFSTKEEAHEAYVKAKRAHHPGCTL